MPSASELLAQPSAILSQMLAFAGNRLSQWAVGDLNFVGKIARMFGIGRANFDAALRQLDADWPPSNQTSLTSLQRQMETFGLPNGSSGYGFKGPQRATGGTIQATGTRGTTYPAGSELTAPDGSTVYVIRGGPFSIPGVPPGTGQVNITIDAKLAGSVGNITNPATLTWSPAPPGSAPTATLIAKVSGGTDTESPGDANQRLIGRLQLPPKGGAPQDFRGWAETATDANGVLIPNLRVYGYSGGDKNSGAGGGYDGLSGVVLVITQIGAGLGRMPTALMLIDILRFVRGTTTVAGLSPTTSSIRCIAPYMDPDVTGLVIKLRVVPSKQLYGYDWRISPGATSGAAPLVVNSAVANQIRITTIAPPSLKLAIDNNEKPRLFVDTRTAGLPVGPVVPPMARCLSYLDGGGMTTLTLELPLPLTYTTPSAGDLVYAGSASINDPANGIGKAVEDYTNDLGTSRVSGLQDPNDLWEDTAAPQGGIDAAAKNTLASDGLTPLISSCLPGEVKIGVGVGAPVAANVQAPDNSTFGPALLYPLRILVTD